ncbi:DNA topoisomerase I, partial [Candidatus Woesebacteria bacterium GWB1_43_5]
MRVIMDLIIVESPTKAKTLSRFLGEGYEVEATMGHLKDLPKSKLSVDVDNNFKPLYEIVVKKADVIERIKLKAKSSKNIYLASDPDREGEAISQHVAELLNSSTVKPMNRIVFHEITKEAIDEALLHPRAIDKDLVDAQIARRVLDRLVGYTLSPLLWKKVRRGLSAGRVQSVAVKLIVEKEKEIGKFKPEEYWEIFCEVKSQKLKVKSNFTAQLIKIGERKAEIRNGETAKKVVSDLEKSNYKVLEVKKREVRKNPYPPFTTSTITQAAANLFGWSAKKTMSTAQILYEVGLITYHRTDSTNIAKPGLDKVRKFIGRQFGVNYLPEGARVYKTKAKVAQEAHEAIRPTDINSEFQIPNSKFQNEAKKLYDLIWRRFVACQMSASVYDETAIDVKAGSNLLSTIYYYLRASGQIMKFDGWRAAYGGTQDNQQALPNVEKDEPLQLIKVDSAQKFTQPPARFNEASLIKTLEALGIGRPSTYAPIISTIQIRQYVVKEEGKFKPTPVGFAVSDFLMKNFPDIVDYDFTSQME